MYVNIFGGAEDCYYVSYVFMGLFGFVETRYLYRLPRYRIIHICIHHGNST